MEDIYIVRDLQLNELILSIKMKTQQYEYEYAASQTVIC